MKQIQYAIGNVLNQKFTECTLICHVVNTESKFGSGFAYGVLKKYPNVKNEYHKWCNNFTYKCDLRNQDIPSILGQVQLIKVQDSPNVYLCQMMSQSTPGGNTFFIGGEEVHLRPIRLDSLRECLLRVAAMAKKRNFKIVGPMFASGLAEGKWDEEIVPLIEECLLKYDIDVTIYKLEQA